MKTRQQPIKLSEIGVGVPPSSDALWREPPPRSARRQTQYLDIANEMASRLGEWRLIGVFDGSTKSAQHFASTIRTHKGAWGNVANEEDGYFEATYTDVDEDGLRCLRAIRGVHMKITGYCPMGCGQTLFLQENGLVRCGDETCSRPLAVSVLLGDPETEHVVEISGKDYSIQHPLRERLDGLLFQCGLHKELGRTDEYRANGVWHVTEVESADGNYQWEQI